MADWTPSGRTRELLTVASEQWRRGLVDISGSNRRLYYRALRVATLDLHDADPTTLKQFLSGIEVTVTALFPDRGTQESFVRQAQARKALDAIWKKAVETEEETGSNPARLGVGAATFRPADAGAAPGRGGVAGERIPHAPLVLIPVRFTPASGTRSVSRLCLDGDPEVNSALRYVLRTQFQADIDEVALLEGADPDGPGGVIIDPSLVSVAAAKALQGRVDGWDVVDHLAIDYFSSDRELMIRDLDDIEVLTAHPLVAAMAGDSAARAIIAGDPLPEPHEDPELANPDKVNALDEFLVLDADSSQQRVIELALAGRNLVVQGPPGTGKSQTISNLIAECAARGKTVLFVAQKRAAIEAVLNRLEAQGLGDLVLQVFDAKTRRAHVMSQLRDAIDGLSDVAPAPGGTLHQARDEHRKLLVQYRDALHRARPELSGKTLSDLYAHISGIASAAQNEERLPVARVKAWGLDGVDSAAKRLRQLADLGALDPSWTAHPGWDPARVTTDSQARDGYDAAVTALASYSEVQSLAAISASEAGLPEPSSFDDVSASVSLLERAETAAAQVVPDLLDPATVDDELLGRLTHAVADKRQRKADKETGLAIGFWERRRLAKQAAVLTQRMGHAPAHATLVEVGLLRAAWGGRVLTTDRTSQLASAFDELESQISVVEPLTHGMALRTADWRELGASLRELREDPRRVRMPMAAALGAQLTAEGAGPVVAAVAARIASGATVSPTEAGDRLRWAALSTLLESIVGSDPALVHGNRAGALDTAEAMFRASDSLVISTNAARVRRGAAEATRSRLALHADQRTVLQAELKKKRKLKSLREMLELAPDAMLAAAPCWAMSPLLVSRYLPVLDLFDIVVYDEASQVTVPDAVPSLLRGRQAVIAGDDKQLPPTTVFTKLLDVDGDSVSAADAAGAAPGAGTEDDEVGDLAADVPAVVEPEAPFVSVATGYASVLAALGSILPSRTLLWHYRSRDERLIAVSNRYVYNRRLITFPGTEAAKSLTHVVVPPSQGVGTHNKSPEAEVTRAVDLCLEHAESQRGLDDDEWQTLGVIAMGTEHANRIEKQLFDRVVELDDPFLNDYFDTGHAEPVFIKNIERVQGDERDHIVLSVGYGPSADGRMRYVWGPLLGTYGVNRLNVAISRARARMTLVTSFTADQLVEGGSSSEGYRLMREFVLFAASSGERDVDQLRTSVPMNAFEADVYGRLCDAGLVVDPQYGVGGYRLDFAVRHPDEPGLHVLAIETDGATYHSGWTARERDRLRQQHLEALGWRFHRIWSTDYWRDPDAEIADAVTSLQEAVQRLAQGERAAAPPPQPEPSWTGAVALGSIHAAPSPAARSRRSPSWVIYGEPIDYYTDAQLRELVTWLRSDGRLLLPDDELSELMAVLGYSRRGSKIVSRLNAATRAVDRSTGR